MTTRTAIYPGTFDPITNGHTDIINRALNICDKLIIAVADDSNSNKSPLFNATKRVELVKKIVASNTNIEVVSFKGLLVDFAKKYDATILIRGIRAVSDFEYEFKMSCMNNRMNKAIDTVFLPASETTQFISSEFVKQIAKLGGDISSFVDSGIENELKAIYN